MLLKRQIQPAGSSPVARIIEAASQIILGKEEQIRMSLACLIARRPYIALDLHHPAGRNKEIMRIAGMVAVITRADFDQACEVIPAILPRIAGEISAGHWTGRSPPQTAPASAGTAPSRRSSGTPGYR